MARLIWSDNALTWLKTIHDYIAQDNPAAAGKVVDGIIQKAEMLCTFPDMGARWKALPDGDVRVGRSDCSPSPHESYVKT